MLLPSVPDECSCFLSLRYACDQIQTEFENQADKDKYYNNIGPTLHSIYQAWKDKFYSSRSGSWCPHKVWLNHSLINTFTKLFICPLNTKGRQGPTKCLRFIYKYEITFKYYKNSNGSQRMWSTKWLTPKSLRILQIMDG